MRLKIFQPHFYNFFIVLRNKSEQLAYSQMERQPVAELFEIVIAAFARFIQYA